MAERSGLRHGRAVGTRENRLAGRQPARRCQGGRCARSGGRRRPRPPPGEQGTSLVAEDKTPLRPADAALKSGAVPTNLPEGWEYDKVFGELPQGATDSRWNLLAGLLTLLLATGLFLTARRRSVVLWGVK
ncbi:MAG: LPXTG cell wall anchor domain-containing protein [Rhodocyclaceae bacterium]|nr:LPXTG cell wall anchor domain-containing protein [Rhodocyclaceae bacterium]